jgi:hypothetical protein
MNILDYLQLCIDIETRARYDNAIITRMAITPFRFTEDVGISFQDLLDRTLYISLDQAEQARLGRVSDERTEKWWSEQDEDLRIESYYPTNNDLKINDAFAEIKRFISSWNYNHYHSHLWARNAHFEWGKIASLNDLILNHPDDKHVLNNWKWMECRTYNYILTGAETEKYDITDIAPDFIYHRADHDACADALRMLKLYEQII